MSAAAFMDAILILHIGSGRIYEYTGDGETCRGIDCDPVQGRARQLRALDWDKTRFDRADFRRL